LLCSIVYPILRIQEYNKYQIMIIEIKVPSPGESISEADMTKWLVSNGDWVEKNQEVGEVESEKATLPLVAPESGKIKILVSAGKVLIGAVVASVDTDAKPEAGKKSPAKANGELVVKEKAKEETAKTIKTVSNAEVVKKSEVKPVESEKNSDYPDVKLSPVAKNMMEENGLELDDIIKGLQRIGKKEVEYVLANNGSFNNRTTVASRDSQSAQMTALRRKLSQRLVAVKNETAMLTTFNEADMSAILELRKKYQDAFQKKHGIKLGFMSFFVKAASEALKIHPMVNSMIDGENIITPEFTDISIAVQTEKGLVVPVLRNVETLSLADIEKQIAGLADRARHNRISMEEMTGGTFTITNGGVFGSMMSTPILNPPQSAILGMHKTMDRPVAVNGKVEIRPMMYLALSYDHRIIDGKDSVGFLVHIKEFIENPQQLLFGNKSADAVLLDL
jgi:2-oxoglutarate dehydrogenase E2 component (dihydrolipoamide succinyltransferase)